MASRIVRVARRVRDVLSELHYATQVANAYRLSYGLPETDRAPDTYAEFLLRTTTASVREPPGRRR